MAIESKSDDDELVALVELWARERRRSVDLVIRSNSKCADRRCASLIAGLLLFEVLLLVEKLRVAIISEEKTEGDVGGDDEPAAAKPTAGQRRWVAEEAATPLEQRVTLLLTTRRCCSNTS
jgi:hypothetical protein